MLPKNFGAVVGTISAIATLYGTSFAAVVWTVQTWPPQPSFYYWILMVAGTVCIPTMIVLTAGWWCSARTSNGISVDDLIVHFLDVCYQDIGIATVELKKEKGPRFARSRKGTAEVLAHYLTSFRTRFERDKELLRRIDPKDKSGLRKKYVDLKQKIIQKCDEAWRILCESLDDEKSKAALLRASESLGGCLEHLDNVRNELASQKPSS